MNRSLTGAMAVAIASLSAAAQAQTCPGDAGYTLKVQPTLVPIGTSFDVTVTAPVGNVVVLFVSTSAGPSVTPYGTLCVAFPSPTFVYVQPCPTLTFPHPIECKSEYVGLKGYLQFISASPTVGISSTKKSNSVQVELINGSCGGGSLEPGDFVTYTQGGWGAPCSSGGSGSGCGGGGGGWGSGGGWGGGGGGCDDDSDDGCDDNATSDDSPGCIRDKYFDKAFPKDLIVGDPDGWDWDCARAAVFSDADAVEDYLPAGGKAGALYKNYWDPSYTSAGVFGGQLVAAKLNIGFDEAGVFDSMKSNPQLKLADLVFIANVHPKLIGRTVGELIVLCDDAISGLASVPLDVDGDKLGDLTFSDLTNALDKLNNEFDGGNQALGSLGTSKN